MNKYEILEIKLNKVNECIDNIKLDADSSKNYIRQYKMYVEKLLYATRTKTIRNSNGALLGLIKGISDYDELCSCQELWNAAFDADNYYSNDCRMF